MILRLDDSSPGKKMSIYCLRKELELIMVFIDLKFRSMIRLATINFKRDRALLYLVSCIQSQIVKSLARPWTLVSCWTMLIFESSLNCLFAFIPREIVATSMLILSRYDFWHRRSYWTQTATQNSFRYLQLCNFVLEIQLELCIIIL